MNDKVVEAFAESFYRYHEALAPDFGCGNASDNEWEHLSSNQRKRFVAAARLALSAVQSDKGGESRGELYCDWSGGGTEGSECGC